MNTLEKIGQVIKQLRISRGLTQEQFCNECRIDQHYISNIENGQRNLSIAFIEKITVFFGMPLSRFFIIVDELDNDLESPLAQVNNTLKDQFISYMKQQRLSEKTIEKYSDTTPACVGVRQIIHSITRRTDDMYHIKDLKELDSIITKVQESNFDQTGHSMYSSGLKKYKSFIEKM